MPRTPAVDKPHSLHLNLPESIYAPLSLLLYSELEGRIPLGAWQRFFVARTQEFLAHVTLDLAPFGLLGAVRGEAEVIELLRMRLLSAQLLQEAQNV